jgi:hypothetical protein
MSSVRIHRFVLTLLIVASPGAAFAADPFCRDLQADLQSKEFVAKVPLYDTKIEHDEILRLERDREEIPEGATATVVNLECGGKKMEMTLKSVGRMGEKVEIIFFLTRNDRERQDAAELFQKMFGYVLEEKQD